MSVVASGSVGSHNEWMLADVGQVRCGVMTSECWPMWVRSGDVEVMTSECWLMWVRSGVGSWWVSAGWCGSGQVWGHDEWTLVAVGWLRGRLRWNTTSWLLHEWLGWETDSSDECGRDATNQRPTSRHWAHLLHSPPAAVSLIIDTSSLSSRLQSRCHLGAESCGSKEPCVSLGHDPDEFICSHKWWQDGNVAFCQITLDNYNYYYCHHHHHHYWRVIGFRLQLWQVQLRPNFQPDLPDFLKKQWIMSCVCVWHVPSDVVFLNNSITDIVWNMFKK